MTAPLLSARAVVTKGTVGRSVFRLRANLRGAVIWRSQGRRLSYAPRSQL